MKYFNQYSKFTFLMILGILMLLNSCTDPGEEEQPGVTTVAEDKVNIQKTFDGVLLCVENFKNGNTVDVLFRDILNLSNGEVLNDLWLEELTTDLSSVINLDNIEINQRFDIAFYAATYTYNGTDKTWSKTSDQINRVVFEFPSSPTETSNNALLIIENYVDKSVTIASETVFVPTAFDVLFSVDATRIIEINLNNIQYASNADFEIPVVLDIDLYLNPMSISVEVSRNSTTSFELLFTATDDDELCDVSFLGSIELNHDDYENLKETDIKKITTILTMNELKVQSLSGIAEYINSEQTINDFNTLVDLEVLFKDAKIGDLEYDEANDALIIIYKDGSKEDTAIYHEGFLNDLEDLWVEFFG